MTLLISIIEQGLLYAPLALGLYIAYQILDFPDLTVDGSFPLGAAVSTALIVRGVNPLLTIFCSTLVGCLAGLLTGVIHIHLEVKDLLAGLITQTGLYTVNLLIAGQSNLPIFNGMTVFNNSLLSTLPSEWQSLQTILILIVFIFIVKWLLDYFLKSKLGFLLKACGDNPQIITSLAQDPGRVKILGLILTNGLVAFSGSLVAQYQKFFDISMGMGTMVMGLASVVLGMKVFGRVVHLAPTTKVIFGSLLYKASVALALMLGLPTYFMKLITALIFLLIMISGRRREIYD